MENNLIDSIEFKKDIDSNNQKIFQKSQKISFDYPITLLFGENGSGKSSILKFLKEQYDSSLDRRVFSQKSLIKKEDIRINYSDIKVEKVFYFNFHLDDMRFLPSFDYDNVEAQILSSRRSSGESIRNQFFEKVFKNVNRDNINEFSKNSMFLLDEPCRGMSFKNNEIYKNLFIKMACEGSKFIISTHSPIILSLQDFLPELTKIYSLEESKEITYKELKSEFLF